MQRTIDNSSARRLTSSLLLSTVLTFCASATLTGQSFPSGSTGADGALNITAPGVTTFKTKPMGGGNVYNFTTINVAQGSTLRLSGSVFPLPLYFLATGAVTIAGTIDLSGQSTAVLGTAGELSSELIGPSVPGAGGYGGGSAGYAGNVALPGLGPAGGGAGGCQGGGFTGNQYLVPLVGGSGGEAPPPAWGSWRRSFIDRQFDIHNRGGRTMTAAGGAGYITGIGYPYPGPGAGGGIRLVAPTIAGNGTITSAAGATECGGNTSGIVRLETYNYSFTGTTGGTLYLATPFNLFIPAATAQPSIMVTSIGGIAVPASPTGSFTVPDVAPEFEFPAHGKNPSYQHPGRNDRDRVFRH